jgi:hypothetical protein
MEAPITLLVSLACKKNQYELKTKQPRYKETTEKSQREHGYSALGLFRNRGRAVMPERVLDQN